MKKKYWYKYYHHYCPVCGKEDNYRVRVYDQPKPEDYRERHIVIETYDFCEDDPYGGI